MNKEDMEPIYGPDGKIWAYAWREVSFKERTMIKIKEWFKPVISGLGFAKTVLFIWMPECVQDRIVKTQMAWERLKLRTTAPAPYPPTEAPQELFDATQAHIQEHIRLLPRPAKKKPAKKKVARKKAKTIPQGKPNGLELLNNGGLPTVIMTKEELLAQYPSKPKRTRRSKAQIEADKAQKDHEKHLEAAQKYREATGA